MATEKLLHFLKQGPDRGVRVLQMIARRQLLRAAECAQKMRAILYDIFLLPASADLIEELMQQGKQHAHKISLHNHSEGMTAIQVFGTLLLLAARRTKQVAEPPKAAMQVLNSIGILHQLCHVARYYDPATHKIALTFGFGSSNQHLQPLALEEVKKLKCCPWPITLPITPQRLAHKAASPCYQLPPTGPT